MPSSSEHRCEVFFEAEKFPVDKDSRRAGYTGIHLTCRHLLHPAVEGFVVDALLPGIAGDTNVLPPGNEVLVGPGSNADLLRRLVFEDCLLKGE